VVAGPCAGTSESPLRRAEGNKASAASLSSVWGRAQLVYTAVSVTVSLVLQYLLEQFPALCHLHAAQGRWVGRGRTGGSGLPTPGAWCGPHPFTPLHTANHLTCDEPGGAIYPVVPGF
jgi:hypothetical protein